MIKLAVFILTFFLAMLAYPSDRTVLLNCQGNADECDEIKTQLVSIAEEVQNDNDLKRFLERIPLNNSILEFSYSLSANASGESDLDISIRTKSKITNVDFSVDADVDITYLEKIINSKIGNFFDSQSVETIKAEVEKYLSDSGVSSSLVTVVPEEKVGGEVNIFVKINVHKVIIKDLVLETDNNFLAKKYSLRFFKFRNKIFNPVDLKIEIDEVSKGLQKEGFYTGRAELKSIESINPSEVVVKYKIYFGEKIIFYPRANNYLTRDEINQLLREKILLDADNISDSTIVSELNSQYEKKGIYGGKIKVRKISGVNRDGISYKNYYIDIVEGKKIPVEGVLFRGVLKRSLQDVISFYYEKASPLAKGKFLDKEFLEEFSKILKENYLSLGFIFVEVSNPIVDIRNGKAYVYFEIKERNKCVLRNIRITGVDDNLRIKLTSNMVNREGHGLNVTKIEDDLKSVLKNVQDEGFLFSQIDNLKEKNIVKYEKNYHFADLNINISTNKKTRLGSITISGNRKTKRKVIEREIKVARNGILSPSVLTDITERLNSLGLFSSVSIKPSIEQSVIEDEEYLTVNLLIQVKEREFGSYEIAPGYRTDIGAKLSFFLIKNNISGLNQSWSFKAQTNYRFNFSSLDLRRKSEENRMLEFLTTMKFSRPYVFNIFDFNIASTYQRKRFYSFDANIFRISPQISKQFTKNISVALKYSFEEISQFDATLAKDNDKFQIGSLTPSLALDFRDDAINPKKGAFFGLSWEFANPSFYSFSSPEKEVNFSKLVSRNKFYYPINNFVLALSVASGFQENYNRRNLLDGSGNTIFNTDGTPKTHGYIPSIKVFRLDGLDVVRGFADSEINRLDDERDISDLRIQNKVYFSVLKFEPRYYLDDSTVVSLFFDAGRLYVDNFKPLSMKTSTGLSFKYLTKVGSLDFDYGVKLKRKRLNNGGREAFGRFHISIGFF